MSSVAQAIPKRQRVISGASVGRFARHWSLRGAAIVYLVALIAVPAAAIIAKGFGEGFTALKAALTAPGSVGAIVLTIVASALAAGINCVFGTMLAYVLVRYRFPGRNALSALVDLPLAVPTLVTGVMLLALYGPSTPLGRALDSTPLQVVGARFGILLALLVVTLPFVVRTVQPVLSELDGAEEEASSTLGASPFTTFRKIVLPALRPALVAGTLLTFARCLGEFGSIVVVSGNITGKTLTAPVLIYQLTGSFKPDQASAIATVLFAMSFVLVLVTTRVLRNPNEEQPE